MDQVETRLEFVAADMPEANRLTVHILALVAQAEREAHRLPYEIKQQLVVPDRRPLQCLHRRKCGTAEPQEGCRRRQCGNRSLRTRSPSAAFLGRGATRLVLAAPTRD
jgi:hypothetical protein